MKLNLWQTSAANTWFQAIGSGADACPQTFADACPQSPLSMIMISETQTRWRNAAVRPAFGQSQLRGERWCDTHCGNNRFDSRRLWADVTVTRREGATIEACNLLNFSTSVQLLPSWAMPPNMRWLCDVTKTAVKRVIKLNLFYNVTNRESKLDDDKILWRRVNVSCS